MIISYRFIACHDFNRLFIDKQILNGVLYVDTARLMIRSTDTLLLFTQEMLVNQLE